MWESKVDIYQVQELRCRTTLYLGVGAITKMQDVAADLKARGIDKVLVVTSRSAYKKCGAWDVIELALDDNDIAYLLYNKVTPNPDDTTVDEAVRLARDFGATAVLGIGGGSPIDAAKSAAILLEYPDKTCKDLYTFAFTPDKAAPVVAVNTTHGTGTEVDRFAVVSIPELNYKPAIAYDCIYPIYAIDDPALMCGLPKNQTLYVSIDSVNHVTEAATSKVASPYTIALAKDTIRLVTRYLPQAVAHPDDLTARYYLLYASAIAGIAFDNGMLHLTHALEHPLSGVKPDLAHGLGLAMLLPSVVEAIYPSQAEVLADIYEPIVGERKGEPGEARDVAEAIERWLFGLGVTSKLEDEGYSEDDVARLTELALETPSLGLLLSMAPVDAGADVISGIYRESLHRLCA